MAIINCPDCQQRVSDLADTCLHCGRPLKAAAAPEQILMETRANMMRGFEAQGGMLMITSRKVQFQPHQFNLSRAPFEIERSDIASVEGFNSLGIIPNGVRIRARSGAEFKFVVSRRERVLIILGEQPT